MVSLPLIVPDQRHGGSQQTSLPVALQEGVHIYGHRFAAAVKGALSPDPTMLFMLVFPIPGDSQFLSSAKALEEFRPELVGVSGFRVNLQCRPRAARAWLSQRSALAF
jgi:hypothetical protein